MISPYHGSVVLMRNNDSSGNESKGSVVSVVQGRSHISSAKIVTKVMQINQRYSELSLLREERFILNLEVPQM